MCYIQAEEKRLQAEYLAFQEQESNKQRERQEQIATSRERAKRDVQKSLRKRRKTLLKKEVCMKPGFTHTPDFDSCTISSQAQVVQSSMTERKKIYSAFNKAEQNMKLALEARKGEIKVYGLQILSLK